MSDWQPIETAPRNGTRFVGMTKDGPLCVFWDDYHPDSIAGKKYLLGEGPRGAFYYSYASEINLKLLSAKPTLWLEIPLVKAEASA